MTGNPSVAGKVEYEYQMGKFEVSRDMVSKANAAGSLGITLADLSSFGGSRYCQKLDNSVCFGERQGVSPPSPRAAVDSARHVPTPCVSASGRASALRVYAPQ